MKSVLNIIAKYFVVDETVPGSHELAATQSAVIGGAHAFPVTRIPNFHVINVFITFNLRGFF